MTGFHQVSIGGYQSGGLTQDKKPLLLTSEAYSKLENAYVFRERTKKRDGEVPMGRLTRVFLNEDIGNTGASPWSFNLFSIVTPVITETYAQIVPGSVEIYFNPTSYTGMIVAGPFAPTINGYTNSSNCEVFSDTVVGLFNGSNVTITGAEVIPNTGSNSVNATWDNVEVIPLNTSFKLKTDSHNWGKWSTGGTWLAYSGLDNVYVDDGLGNLVAQNSPGTNFGTINYESGAITITHTSGAGIAAEASFNYYPNLPVMGILKRDVESLSIESTVFFDTTYAYQYVNGFQELVVGTTWTGTYTDFFWSTNYQGPTSNLRYFFATNNNIDIVNTTYDPIRYYNNSTWVDFKPLISATTTLWQARILIPYYGRLLALNTWEGVTADTYTKGVNYFARCRFSSYGDATDQGSTGPYVPGSWAVDKFGRGGFLDAATNEAITGATFYRNTLIVFFEYSTWQLRYTGESDMPFIWERISSDFGSVSTFSSILFDEGVMSVSNRGVIQASSGGLSRIDEQIPEQIFSFQIQNNAPNFVHGIRDFEKELVYWNYIDKSTQAGTQIYPNTVLLFNYKNNTWAKFRDTITCFGPAQFQFGITWDSLTTSWNSSVSWDNVDDQAYVNYVTCGTQHGFINIYQNPNAATPVGTDFLYAPTLAITAVDFTPYPSATKITIPSHNLANGETIYISGTIWLGTDPGLNDKIYRVTVYSRPSTDPIPGPDPDVITLSEWNQTSLSYESVNISSAATYLGGGVVTLFPKMNIVGKDFNPFQAQGSQFKLSFIDFQLDSNLFSPAITALTIQLFINSRMGEQANFLIGNQGVLNGSQDCGYITKVYTGPTTDINPSNPCQIRSLDHSLITGTQIYIANIQGTTELNTNPGPYVITVVDSNNFTLNGIDASAYTTYVKGGIWTTYPTNGQTYIPGSEYAWYRFYSTQFGQYLRVGITYDDSLMNQSATHQTAMELNGMNLWFRSGGRIIN